MSAPPDQAVRDRVRTDFDTTFLLEAGAGTGKTSVLISRILALVQTGRATLDRVVAITFTEKAAGELKLRLHDDIETTMATTSGVEHERPRGRGRRLGLGCASVVGWREPDVLQAERERWRGESVQQSRRASADVRHA